MTDLAACDRCAKSVKKEDELLKCMGFCDQICHIRCAGLNGPFIKVVREKHNLFWMCDECVKLMKYTRFKNVVSSFGSVVASVLGDQLQSFSELKDEIAKNNQHVAKLADKVNSATPVRIPNRDRPAKRRRGEPESPNEPAVGTRHVENQERLVAKTPPNLFWVYLSRFHPTVTIDVVEKLVRDGLETQDATKVVPRVKKGTDLQSLNFVSFKVGVPPEHKATALRPGTWPLGIVFREFSDTRANSTVWSPPTASVFLATPVTVPNDNIATGTASATSVAQAAPAPFGATASDAGLSETPATVDL
ncbi:uncharacterized protein LOC129728375 [Wyeomyia smithii]|uniref:uncharacterized protein LOC129728375 n=1 Tax=Wyeomyia smithii TaxID=174621 RepID=UPI002467EE57|nr:uncharacterized protein LOC129728375 [Wyeomyia smithii]